jgi:predicted regulator of Ras-like GTPase activity (Roadblock/LC7/MglB family)
MTLPVSTDTSAQLSWLLDDLTQRVTEVGHAIVLSSDGLLLAGSRALPQEEAQRLAAVASGFHSLAKGTGRHFGGGAVRQTVVEMEMGYLFVSAAGENACLAVLAPEGADIGLVAYEMARLVTRVGQHLAVADRNGPQRPDEHLMV